MTARRGEIAGRRPRAMTTDAPGRHVVDGAPTTAGLGSLGATASSPDIFVYYARLLDRGGVVWDEDERAWLVASYEAVRELLRRDGDFIGGFVPRDGFSLNGLSGDEWVRWNGGSRRASPALVDSGELHTHIHRWWMHLYTPKDLEAVRTERFNRTLSGLVDRFAVAGRAELVSEYAHRATPRIMADMLDIPYTDAWIDEMLERFKVRAAFLATQGLRQTPDPDLRRDAWRAIDEIRETLLPYVAARRSGEGSDFISRIWRDARFAFGDDCSDVDVISVIVTWWSSGSSTIGHACINALYLALQQLEWRDAAANGDQRVLRALVEESLRLYGPSHWVPRVARHDVTLAGAEIKAGDRLLAMLEAANLDPARYEASLTARLDRPSPRSHFSFSAGPRTCAGQALARAELEEMVSVLLRRLPDVRIAADAEAPRYQGLVVRTWSPLHVTFTPARGRTTAEPTC
jgi:cytochrome P450